MFRLPVSSLPSFQQRMLQYPGISLVSKWTLQLGHLCLLTWGWPGNFIRTTKSSWIHYAELKINKSCVMHLPVFINCPFFGSNNPLLRHQEVLYKILCCVVPSGKEGRCALLFSDPDDKWSYTITNIKAQFHYPSPSLLC